MSVSVGRVRRAAWTRLARLLVALLAAGGAFGRADEPVFTVLADFEDNSVAARIGQVRNVSLADCEARPNAIPARGQKCLAVEVGATVAGVSADCDLRFRVDTPFDQADQIVTFCWIKSGEIQLTHRVRDARGRAFETQPVTVRDRNRWVRVSASLTAEKLTGSEARDAPVWPLTVLGYRLGFPSVGRQTVYLDDLQVEHHVPAARTIHGEFRFDRPTKIYEPGATVGAAVVLENGSRSRAARVSVELSWMQPDGSVLKTQQGSVNLPPSGIDFRSRQPIDFSQRVEQPGLYRLVARARAAGWKSDYVFETSVAVTPSNRNRSRGRSTFFGLRTNLLREPLADQHLEIDVAREIGVELLALDVPWRVIEPRQDKVVLDPVDPLIEAIIARRMAAMIVLTEPPEWLPAEDSQKEERRAAILEALVTHFGDRVRFYQPWDEDDPPSPGRAARYLEIQRRVSAIRPSVRIMTAPLRIVRGSGPADAARPGRHESGMESLFGTRGDPVEAVTTLRELADSRSFTWHQTDRWFHVGPSLARAGSLYDAIGVLRYFGQAAASGVAGLIWFDLRDDGSDRSEPEALRGLVTRDFSPKAPLLGYATAVGLLSGLGYSQPVLGAPPSYESALFIGSDRQVAVLLPRPNRLRPALLAPIRGVPGDLAVFDFERRPVSLLASAAPPLVPALARPMFITLGLESAQPEPQVALAKPWLRVPGTVLCGSQAEFAVDVDVPMVLRRSFIQVILPTDSPVDCSFSARALKGALGETVSFPVRVTPKKGAAFERAALTVRVSLEGTNLDVPVEIRPLTTLGPLSPRADVLDESRRCGELAADDSKYPQPLPVLHAAWEERALHLAVVWKHAAEAGSVSQTLIGAAAEGADTHLEAILLEQPDGSSRAEPAFGGSALPLAQWRVSRVRADAGSAGALRVEIPAASLGIERFRPGARVLLAVRSSEGPAGGAGRVIFGWGSGLDGTRSADGFRWMECAADAER